MKTALVVAGVALWALGLEFAPTLTLIALGFPAACCVALGWAMHRAPDRWRP